MRPVSVGWCWNKIRRQYHRTQGWDINLGMHQSNEACCLRFVDEELQRCDRDERQAKCKTYRLIQGISRYWLNTPNAISHVEEISWKRISVLRRNREVKILQSFLRALSEEIFIVAKCVNCASVEIVGEIYKQHPVPEFIGHHICKQNAKWALNSFKSFYNTNYTLFLQLLFVLL